MIYFEVLSWHCELERGYSAVLELRGCIKRRPRLIPVLRSDNDQGRGDDVLFRSRLPDRKLPECPCRGDLKEKEQCRNCPGYLVVTVSTQVPNNWEGEYVDQVCRYLTHTRFVYSDRHVNATATSICVTYNLLPSGFVAVCSLEFNYSHL